MKNELKEMDIFPYSKLESGCNLDTLKYKNLIDKNDLDTKSIPYPVMFISPSLDYPE